MSKRAFLFAAILAALQIARADTYPVILHGTVVMEDGSVPPFTVGIERTCSDSNGGTPGPITNKKGEWLWRLEINAFDVRSCFFRARHEGYSSSAADASNLNITTHDTTLTIPPLILYPAVADPYTIRTTQDSIPGKAKGPFEKAMKAMDAHNYAETGQQLEAAVAAAPKFAAGWHALGVVDENLNKPREAREAYEHAIAADPKLLPAYVTLARNCLKSKDWQCVEKASADLIKMDQKKIYPEIHLHRAVARYGLKDFAGAHESIQEAIRTDPGHRRPRAEYVMGRILEAQGDLNGAKEHMTKYLELDKNPPDGEVVRAHLAALGKPGASDVDPDLEPI
jgi:tetratricopeptide (TPR) repeat protein